MKKKDWEYEDDGRTIADMSGVDAPRLLIPRFPKKGGRTAGANDDGVKMPGQETGDGLPKQTSGSAASRGGLSGKERGWYAAGAMRAALLIGLAYIVGIGLLIAILIAVWKG